MNKTILAAVVMAAISGPAMAANCYDGKTDDCTAAWSLAHKPKTLRDGDDKDCSGPILQLKSERCLSQIRGPTSDQQCLGHVHYMADGMRKSETFAITAMTINQKTGATLYGGHGTNWYAPNEIRITGHCNFIPQHTPVDSQGDKYYEPQ